MGPVPFSDNMSPMLAVSKTRKQQYLKGKVQISVLKKKKTDFFKLEMKLWWCESLKPPQIPLQVLGNIQTSRLPLSHKSSFKQMLKEFKLKTEAIELESMHIKPNIIDTITKMRSEFF